MKQGKDLFCIHFMPTKCKQAFSHLHRQVGGKLTFGKELEDEIKEQVEETKEKTGGIMEETEKTLRLIERMGATQKASEQRFKDRLKEVKEEIEKDVSDVKELAKIKECASKCKKGKLRHINSPLMININL